MGFGKWSIDESLFNKILELLDKNKTILEFGSGYGSGELSKYFEVYSIEHDINWLNKYPTNYIYAPLKKYDNEIKWYDVDIIKNEIPDKYDLILVDGPPKPTSKYGNGRMGFYYNLNLFNLDGVIIIFDDVQRKNDYYNMKIISEKLNRNFIIFDGHGKVEDKKFAVVCP